MSLQTAVKLLISQLGVSEAEAGVIVEKGIAGGEVTDESKAEQWVTQRLLPYTVFIDLTGYSRMCVDALKILSTTAATDFGGSRQRDLGQLWADMTRGYLGEYAFKLFVEKKCGIEVELGHEKGDLKKYLPMDIHQVREPRGSYRVPKISIGVKAIKWNGIWLDVPGDQFNHSDVHVLVKVGTARDHLFAFFKQISVFKDKVLAVGRREGSLTEKEEGELFDRLPGFKPIPAYICGFVRRVGPYSQLSYSGKRGRKHFVITAWKGPFDPRTDLDKIRLKEKVKGAVKFSGIDQFSRTSRHLFNTGNLLWEKEDWDTVLSNL